MSKPITRREQIIAKHPGRKHKLFWTITDHGVIEAVGFECPPNDGVWWLPEAGFSTSASNLYQTEAKALAVHCRVIREQIAGLTRALAEAENRLAVVSRPTG